MRSSRLGVSTVGFVFAVVSVLLAFAAPSALAAPANDNFADRQSLTGLPVEVSTSNVGATKEPGESLTAFAAGRSVWFEWEAVSTGWVTIGSCGSDFPAILAIFTGGEVNKLTPVVQGNADEGPGCMYSQSQYTFKAESGTDYAIAVDGNAFFLPGAPPPVTQGGVVLRIEQTLRPPNDLFGSPGVLSDGITEEPGGDRFYFAKAIGYNWAATVEPGEPSFGAGAGASVWYSWTPPESGKYRLNGPCCSTGLDWALYRGDAPAGLVQVLPDPGGWEFAVVAGERYRIVVFGMPDLATGEPTMASFSFIVSGRLAPTPQGLPPGSEGTAAASSDRLAPQTTISRKTLKRKPPIFVFSFGSDERGSSFRCSLDGSPFKACDASRTFKQPGPKRHTLRVYAVDPAGNADPSPAVAHFKIPPLVRRHAD